jgi:hypothetical protein
MPPRTRRQPFQKPVPLRECPACGINIEPGSGEYGLAHHEHRPVATETTAETAESIILGILVSRVKTGQTEPERALEALARLKGANRKPGRPAGEGEPDADEAQRARRMLGALTKAS